MIARSTALTAALFGLNAASASAAGCYSAYSSGQTYGDGDIVSASTSTTTPITYVQCDPSSAGCPASGQKQEGGVTTTITKNYKCWQPAFCGLSGHEPAGIHSASAWEEMGECTGTATPATAPVPAAWSGGGCPKAYSAGGQDAYDEGDVVSVVKTTYTAVYACAAAPNNQFCGMTGYEPNEGQYWSNVWTELGSCTGTLAPTDSPSFETLADMGGCPRTYSSGTTYEEGDKISKDGFVYQCKGWPQSQHCSQAGYEPGVDVGGLEYWKDAWSVAGYCSGTIAPTTSPNYVALEDMGGCPDAWEAKTQADPTLYEEGDRVSSQGLVFQCKAWPYSGHCGQAGYEPNVNPATPEAWKDAWTVVGYCNGSMNPTISPTIDPATSLGACPEEWSAGIHTKYEEGDMVSVVVSAIPLRKVAFRCKAWPYSGHCAQHAPGTWGGDLGWAVAGGCDGSIGPTQSPSFDKLREHAGGCPEEWRSSKTDYEAGDLVAYTLSVSPVRKLVYECKAWPDTGYCNQGAGFEPTTTYSDMAWDLKGSCTGSMAPTDAPAVYSNTCTYIKCEQDVECAKDAASNGVTGSTACTCTTANQGACSDYNSNTQVGTKGTQTKCEVTPVAPFNDATDYDFGDIIRVGQQKFRCKYWPNGLWCEQEAYKPTREAGIWNQAWDKIDMCP